MIQLPRPLRRLLILLPIGAGWLAILGNSPPADLERSITGQSGSTMIALWGDVSTCTVRATLSAPVRRATWSLDGKVIEDIACVDGSDCIGKLSLPVELTTSADPGSGNCVAVGVDAAAVSGDANASPDARAEPDATLPADVASPSDGAPTGAGGALGAGAGGTVADADPTTLLPDASATPPVATRPDRFTCEGTGLVQSTTSWDGCHDGSHDFKLEVETAAGARSTVDYHIEQTEPKGYFGC